MAIILCMTHCVAVAFLDMLSREGHAISDVKLDQVMATYGNWRARFEIALDAYTPGWLAPALLQHLGRLCGLRVRAEHRLILPRYYKIADPQTNLDQRRNQLLEKTIWGVEVDEFTLTNAIWLDYGRRHAYFAHEPTIGGNPIMAINFWR